MVSNECKKLLRVKVLLLERMRRREAKQENSNTYGVFVVAIQFSSIVF